MDEKREIHAILVAVNSNNEDILPTDINKAENIEEDILENAYKCPVFCPPASPLNT